MHKPAGACIATVQMPADARIDGMHGPSASASSPVAGSNIVAADTRPVVLAAQIVDEHIAAPHTMTNACWMALLG